MLIKTACPFYFYLSWKEKKREREKGGEKKTNTACFELQQIFSLHCPQTPLPPPVQDR